MRSDLADVLFVSGEYPPDVGGVGDYSHRLRGALAARGWSSRLLSRAQVGRWDARSLVWLLRTAPGAGLVHIQYQAAAFDLLGDACLMPLVLQRLRPAVRVVTTFHDARVPYLFPRAGALRKRAVRLMADSSHAVIAADERDLALLGGPSVRHHNLPIGANVPCSPPPGFDRTPFRARLGVAPDELAVVYFGLLNSSKGLDLLVDTFDQVISSGHRAKLLLIGGDIGASDPTDGQTAARISDRLVNLGHRLVRTGWLAPSDLSSHLLAADIALLPYADGASARRGSLLVCAEHRLPIVSTQPASPALAAAVQAVPATPAALSAAVLRIADDPALARSLRASSRALARASSWSTIADGHIRLYQTLL